MTPPARSLPQATESVCPVCLRRIPAEYVLDPAEEGIPSVLCVRSARSTVFFPFPYGAVCRISGLGSATRRPRIPGIRSWSGSAVVLSTAGCARIMPSIPVRG